MRATMASAESDFDRQKLPHDLILILADGTSGALEVADALGYVFLDDSAQPRRVGLDAGSSKPVHRRAASQVRC
jgi:hypothetical protein